MSTRIKKCLLPTLLVISLLTLGSMLLHAAFKREHSAADAVSSEKKAPLPADIEGVMTSFSFSESYDNGSVKISGKSVIRRGRAVLGMRSNLVKTNFIDALNGTVRTRNGITTFSAEKAEWEGQPSRPLFLKKGVSITMNGKPLEKVNHARIHLKSGVIEVNNDGVSYRMN